MRLYSTLFDYLMSDIIYDDVLGSVLYERVTGSSRWLQPEFKNILADVFLRVEIKRSLLRWSA